MPEPDHRRGPFAPAASPAAARLRRATMELVLEGGFEQLTVAAALERADADPDALDPPAADPRDLCTRIYLANIAEFDHVVFAALPPPGAWRPRLRAAAYAAADYVAERPTETRFDMVQMLAAGPLAAAHRDRYVRRIVDLIDEGRSEAADPHSLSRSTAEGILGAIYDFLFKQLRAGAGAVSARDFVPELMCIAVRPYLGHEAAMAELRIPPPPPAEER